MNKQRLPPGDNDHNENDKFCSRSMCQMSNIYLQNISCGYFLSTATFLEHFIIRSNTSKTYDVVACRHGHKESLS